MRKCVALVLSVFLLMQLIPAVSAHPDSYHAADLSEGVQNIVKRAKQMTGIQWTPREDIIGWGGWVTYRAGVTYTGLPYGRPHDEGSYIPWETSLTGFLKAVKDPDSRMYTSYASHDRRAPYYSQDCSAFVSWAWDLPERQHTTTLPDYAVKISDSSYAQMEVGDCLSRAGYHVVLVTDLVYDASGKIIAVELSESDASAPDSLCHSFWFGEGHSRSMGAFQKKYLDNGYTLYRCKTRDSVTYTHSCASPLPGDSCSCMERARSAIRMITPRPWCWSIITRL